MTQGTLMKLIRCAVVAMLAVGAAGCADMDMGQLLKNTAAGTAESACRAASNCSTGMRRDALAPRPSWDRGGASPNDSPFRLPPPK